MDARKKLATLAGHAAVAAEVDKRIVQQVKDQLAQIERRLDELRPQVMLDRAAEDEYLQLVKNRVRLNFLLAEMR